MQICSNQCNEQYAGINYNLSFGVYCETMILYSLMYLCLKGLEQDSYLIKRRVLL